MTLDAAQFSNRAGIAAGIRRAQRRLRPPPNLLPSQWAERSVRIPEGNARPGLIRFDNAPYQRQPMDMALNPDCYRITLKWGAQVGKTMLALCLQGYFIEVRPRSQMMMQPSQPDLTTWLEAKFNPMVDANDNLADLIAKPRGRDGVNNQRMKSYPGGFMMFAWSGSPKTMRGRSAPFIVCDEVDGYGRTQEGHPVGILWQRAATFGDDRLLLEISTPTVKGASYIDDSYHQGDERQFYVLCPHCEAHQTLKWDQVEWQGKSDPKADQFPATAVYMCEACGVGLNDGERIAAIRTAEEKGAGWKGAKEFKGHASYHLNELYSTFRRLRDIVQSYLDKVATNDIQTFINVSLAEVFEEENERADPETLRGRVETFAAEVPMGAAVLTCGIDMQMDRLEYEVVGWGISEESWSVEYGVLWGDPLQSEVWEDLDDLLARSWTHESGARMGIDSALLDTGGTSKDGASYTQAAYDYCKGKTGRRFFAGKGVGGWGRPIVAAPSKKQSGKHARKVDLFQVGSDEAKKVIMRRLALKPRIDKETGEFLGYPQGYCHVPASRRIENDAWFDQITAERLQTRYVKGHAVREWVKDDHARNEALDCRQYALAALKIYNPNLARKAEKLAERARLRPAPAAPLVRPPPEPATAPEETPPPPAETGKKRNRRPPRQRQRRNWATQW